MKYQHKIVSLCISRLFDIENRKFVVQLNKKLKKENCSLLIYHINTDLYWEDELTSRPEAAVFDLVDFQITDILIIMDEKIKSRPVSEKLIRRAKENQVPVIIVDGSYPDCSSVNFDYKAGFEKIVRHVMEVHHVKKPHFMAGIKGNPFSDERLEVFRNVIEEHHIPFREDMVSYGLFWAKPAIEATEKIIQSGNLPEAIICANDIMAINVANTLMKHGIRIPEQVIVTGFDGIEELYFSVPHLLSVRCGCSDLSDTVSSAVSEILEKPDMVKQYSVKPFLLWGNSCGCFHPEETKQLFNFNDRFYRYQDDRQILYEITEKMQSCDDIVSAGWCLFREQLHDMTFIINPWCMDNTINHFETSKVQTFEEEMFLFFDTDIPDFQQKKFPRSELLPNLKHYLDREYPLIFNAVGFMGVPLGYLCFHFPDCELVNYCKLPQIINIIGAGLGGYMNRQYQHYLIKQLEFIYKYDALTSLLNRMCFSRELEELQKESQEHELSVTVILSDLDGLKTINDKFGHNAGDNAIRTCAAALKASCPDEALCVRFGGDEMLAVITGNCDAQNIRKKIRIWLEDYNQHSGLEYQISSSIGIHTGILNKPDSLEIMIQKADDAMYTEKKLNKSKAK